MGTKENCDAGLVVVGVLVFLCSMPAITLASTKIIVGGDQHWRFGFNYTDWALRNQPFYQNDILVFKYDPPNSTTFPHSVYLLPTLESYINCNLKGAKLVANVNQGGDQGFEFLLKKRKNYYFACGESGGFHCSTGLMKFFIRPVRSSCHG